MTATTSSRHHDGDGGTHTIKSLLFELIGPAAQAAKENYENFSQRDLYYNCRNRYLNHPARPHDREFMLRRSAGETDKQYRLRREEARRTRAPIDYKYFTTNILRKYEQQYGVIVGMIREPHGTFIEPHSGESLELGTLEVAAYDFPAHRFDKILYVEKGTERTKFEAERIAEKYDMGMVYGRGYATEAIQGLLQVAEGGDYQIFVWHDADVDGYNIVRNLREDTENIPGITLEVIDLGLTVEEAVRIGCQSEPFNDNDALPHKLHPLLNDLELEYFEERQLRFEINGINPPSRRMAYVEDRLRHHGVRAKYVPPEEPLRNAVDRDYDVTVKMEVSHIVDNLVDTDAIAEMVADELRDELSIEDPETLIRERFETAPTSSWSSVVHRENRRRVAIVRERIREVVAEAVVTTVTGEPGDDE